MDMKVPERCGLLMVLGMSYDEALKIAEEPDMYSLGGSEMQDFMKKVVADPFVREIEDAFIVSARDHDGYEYTVLKERVESAEDILGWVDHLATKAWVTREHIRVFIGLTSRYLKLKIHPI